MSRIHDALKKAEKEKAQKKNRVSNPKEKSAPKTTTVRK